jgi:hypothetical protein
MVQKRIEQGAAPVAGSGVDNQPGRLVDDHQRVILEDHGERNVFG